MIWGSKLGLIKFLRENNIYKLFAEYMKKNDYLNKAGIYLCINIDKNIGYFIIWPGNFNYKYHRIAEPNDNILLTLIRYGFSISTNSILCFTKSELEKFDFNGYKIFQDNDNSVLLSERRRKVYPEGCEEFLHLHYRRYWGIIRFEIDGNHVCSF